MQDNAASSRCLATYVVGDGSTRRLLAREAESGTLLVVDTDAAAADVRLLAHLGADEPPANAELVCREYLAARSADRGCRRLSVTDLRGVPAPEQRAPGSDGDSPEEDEDEAGRPLEVGGCCYALAPARAGGSIAQLRWWRHERGCAMPVSLRALVAAMESYDPACARTTAALADWRDSGVSTTVLRAELRRLRESPIVLNRRLREAVLAALDERGVSMSEIALRCGRVKRDRQGNESGETSWLARRLGLLGDASNVAPTPWIHSDVLARIARCGLGLSPREVEA